jgi:tetratricopeptide (TPR) repeat protein
MDQASAMMTVMPACRFLIAVLLLTGLCLPAAKAGNIQLSSDAQKALDLIYTGDPGSAIGVARAMQQNDPQNPLGYLLEGESLWWKRYCGACEIKFGMIEAWQHEKLADDESYLALTDRAVQLAKDQLARSETAEMHFYAGMGYALKVRVYGLRNENRNAARAGVNARSEMLRALELDPQLADATAAVGIYNYYVDTLSPVVKLLRFFMGIPGGNKELGVKQMEIGMNQGALLAVDVRFILARALRQYDQKYQDALEIAEPLIVRYPQNPLFLLLVGNLNVELGRKQNAMDYFTRAKQSLTANDPCTAHAHAMADVFIAGTQ